MSGPNVRAAEPAHGSAKRRVAVVHAVPAGAGGLGLVAATAIAGFVRGGHRVHALGPGYVPGWPLAAIGREVTWSGGAPSVPTWAVRYTPLRRYQGLHVQWGDWRTGRWAASELDRVRPDVAYLFTQVALEGLRWCKRRGVPSILDSPNGSIRNFRAVCEREWARWCGGSYPGHPTRATVARVEEEYMLADRIRVPSAWAKRSLVAAGVDAAKIAVVDLPVDLRRFHPPARRAPSEALRLLFVGSIDARKGVLPLLRAVRAAGRARVRVALVGATGSRPMRLALARESKGLDVTVGPADPLRAYHAADVFVLPSLEDAFGFVAAEAMACGVPLVVTDQCGSAEWVERANAGWVVPAGDERAMADAIEDAASRHAELGEMGARGRAYVEERAGERCFNAICELISACIG